MPTRKITKVILEWFKYTVGYPATFCFSVLAILNVDTTGSHLPAKLPNNINDDDRLDIVVVSEFTAYSKQKMPPS